jgi:hypothetical protein
MSVAEVSKQTIVSAWHGNVLRLSIVGLAEKDMAMSSCTAQNGGATTVLTRGKLSKLQFHRLLQDDAAFGALPFEVCDGSSGISDGIESFLDSLQRGLYSHVREFLRMDVVKVRLENGTCYGQHREHLLDMDMTEEW